MLAVSGYVFHFQIRQGLLVFLIFLDCLIDDEKSSFALVLTWLFQICFFYSHWQMDFFLITYCAIQ